MPLQVFDSTPVRQVLQKHVRNGGAFPKADGIRKTYLPRIHDAKVQELKQLLQDSDSFSLVFDEQTDTSQDFVLHILAVPQSTDGTLKAVLLSSEYLEETNSVTVAQAILRVCHEWALDLNKICAVASDGAAYCSKAFMDSLKGIFPNAVHVICNAHIMSLVSEQWRSCFPEVDLFCAKMKRVFSHSVARKRRFRDHLASKGCSDVRNPPEPVVTRWTSWYNAVAFHNAHFEHYRSFFEAECEEHSGTIVSDLCSLVDSPTLSREIAFIAEHCARPQAVLTSFEATSAGLHLVYDKVLDLLA